MSPEDIAAYHAGVQRARTDLAAARDVDTTLATYTAAVTRMTAASEDVVRARAVVTSREIALAEDVLNAGPAPDGDAGRDRARAHLAEAEGAYRAVLADERRAILEVRRARAALLSAHPELHAVLPVMAEGRQP